MALDSVKLVGLVAVAAALWSVGCSEGTDDVFGTGGATGTGGSGQGGAPNGDAGTPGAAGAPAPVVIKGEAIYAFAEDLESFKFERYAATDPYVNLAYSSQNPYATDPEIEWSSAPGPDEAPGSVLLTVPFGAYNELVDIQTIVAEPTAAADWSGKILRAYVKVDEGFVSSVDNPGGAYLFVKTGAAYVYGRGAWTNLDPAKLGSWIELEFDVSLPEDSDDGYDATQIVAVGIQISAGQGPTTPGAAPTPATLYVDHITIE